MDKISWIQDIVEAEKDSQKSHDIDSKIHREKPVILEEETQLFLTKIRLEIEDVASAFNELKDPDSNELKIYNLALPKKDFMLFRNGYKLIFKIVKAGQINVSFQFTRTHFVPINSDGIKEQHTEEVSNDDLEAFWGAFNAITWKCRGLDIKFEELIHYYMNQFLLKSRQ